VTLSIRRIAGVGTAVALMALAACGEKGSSEAPPLAPPVSTSPDGSGACDAADVDADVVRFSSGGSCRPVDVMVMFRCAPTEAPVLRLSSGTEAVDFLGGPYAVSVDALPANVVFAGEGDGVGVLVAHPGTPTSPTSMSAEPHAATEPLVYVRRDGVTERWLRLPSPTDLHDRPVAWLIGDSILDGGRDFVRSSLEDDWDLTIDAEVGRPSSEGLPLAEDAAGADADVVLVELGTNDVDATETRTNLVSTLDVLSGVPLVLWQTTKGPPSDPSIAEATAAIRDVVPRYPNAAIADWEAFVPPEDLETDGIHPDEGAERLESELLEPLLSGWLAAVNGDGATACEDDVLRAAA
jgi:hypothetical protein